MSGRLQGKSTYQKIVDAGFCYVGQKEICQNGPTCTNGSHECYQCWKHGIRAMHGCYTKKIDVCKTRSPEFEHYAERESVAENEENEDETDEDFDEPIEQFGVSAGQSSRPSVPVSRRPGNAQQKGATRFKFVHRRTTPALHSTNPTSMTKNVAHGHVTGPSHGRQDVCSTDHFQESRPSKRSCKQTSEDCREQVEKESLQTRVVQLEGELKLVQQENSFKDETHKLHTENLERVIVEKKDELESIRSQNSTLQTENIKIKLEKDTQEEKHTEQVQQYELQIAKLRQEMAHERRQNKLIIERLTQQKQHRPQLGSNGLFSGQIISKPLVPLYYTCKFNGCLREFSLEEKENGAFTWHLINAHGVPKQALVDQGLSFGRFPSMPGPSSGSRSGTGLQNYMNPGQNNGMSFPGHNAGSRSGNGATGLNQATGPNSSRGARNRLLF